MKANKILYLYIQAYKTDEMVNKIAEAYTMESNPSQAYDRVTEDKHIINKNFYFKKDEVLGENEKQIAQFLELSFSGALKKKLRIDEKLYEEPSQIVPELFKKPDESELYDGYKKFEQEQMEEFMDFQKIKFDLEKGTEEPLF